MRIDIMTLFPDSMNAMLHESILGRAAKKGLIEINCIQIRDFTDNKQCQVDDYPYGGGRGCVMMAQPLKSCLEEVRRRAGETKCRVIYMTPQGKPYDQETAKRLKNDYDHLILVCGHYEGIDERFIEECVDEEISVGDFVLTGGEIAAMAVTDSVCRLVPGVLSDEECFTGESHWSGVLEYPQYTRPETWEGRKVPPVLLKGDHAEVDRWRRKMSLKRTMEKRPDMFERLELTESDKKLLEELKKDEKRLVLTEPSTVRKATGDDLESIMLIVRQAKNSLKKHRVDQWQGNYPNEAVFCNDIDRGECFMLMYGKRVAGFFVLSTEPEEHYESIRDGKWSREEPYCVLHRAAVAAEFRGSGISAELIDHVKRCTLDFGRAYIRTDTQRKNKAMQKLLRSKGFGYRGNVTVPIEGERDAECQCYDYIIKDKNL